MRLKYYVRGLGTGILFSVIVMSLTGASNQPKMTDSEIIHAAKALGMVEGESKVNLTGLSPTPTVTPTAKPSEDQEPTKQPLTEPTSKPSDSDELTMTPKPSMEPIITKVPEPTIALEPTKAPEPTVALEPTKAPVTQEGSEKKTVTLNIVKGMYSNDVAKEAYRLGLIDDIKAFNKYMSENGFASKIHIGTYELEIGASLWEIAQKITKK